MSNNPYYQFIGLAKLDQQLILDSSKIELLKTEIEELNKKLEDASKDLALAQQMLVNLRKRFDESQLELRSLDEQESKKKRNLANTQNPKQYESLTHEIDIIVKSKDTIENNILSWYGEIDNLSKLVQVKKADFEKFKSLTTNSIQEKQAMIDLLEKEADKVKTEWELALGILPEEWVQKYKKMRESVNNPVVPVIGNSCSACFADLTAATINGLRHHKLINCPECYRLLYIEEKKS